MKRREVLKALTTVAGRTLLPATARSVLAQQPALNANLPHSCPFRHLPGKTEREPAANRLTMSIRSLEPPVRGCAG